MLHLGVSVVGIFTSRRKPFALSAVTTSRPCVVVKDSFFSPLIVLDFSYITMIGVHANGFYFLQMDWHTVVLLGRTFLTWRALTSVVAYAFFWIFAQASARCSCGQRILLGCTDIFACLHSWHLVRHRLCMQSPLPWQSVHWLRTRKCWQRPTPPQCLHLSRRCLWIQSLCL